MTTQDALFQAVQLHGWAVFPGIEPEPANAALLSLGRRFGMTSWQGTRSGAPNLENDGVNRVEKMDTPMRDAIGNPVLSSNSEEFPLHTDDSYSPNPARYVLMHCWQADVAGGGESWLAHVDQIAALASPDLLERLSTQPYTTPYGSATVLRRGKDARWAIRFNKRDMIGFAHLRCTFLSQQKRDDLAAFELLAMQCKEKVSLRQGDCIVVDNHRVLHGRSAFNPASGRLIKRLRILGAEAV
jgi:alpha-ketoglutarate-dependent taurine dioxygenase